MRNYLLKKLFGFFICVFVIITITFFLIKSIPGNPFLNELEVPEEVLKNLYSYYGLDKPLFVQYLVFLKGCFLFDLGPSMIYQGRYVSSIIKEGFVVSAQLGFQSFLIAMFCGISLGVASAYWRGSWKDSFSTIVATLGISIPNFVFASLLQYYFSVKFSLFPVARWDSFVHTILPTIALTVMPTAYISRIIRSNLIEVLEQDYIKTAKAKGLKTGYWIFHQALRVAMIPLFSYLGPLSAYLLTGSFVLEKIFAVPGLGQWTVSSILNRDYPLVMGLVIFYSVFLLFCIYLTDILRIFFDPRIKEAKRYE